MKKIHLYTVVLMVIISATVFISCNKNNDTNSNNDVMPAAKLDASISGDYSEQIHINLPGNYLDPNPNGQVLNGGYTSVNDMMIITAAFNIANGGITIVAHTGGINTGTFNYVNSQTTYNNAAIGASGFVAPSGTLIITKTEYITTVGNDKDYYISGSFSGTMENQDNPAKVINMSGTFSGVHVPD